MEEYWEDNQRVCRMCMQSEISLNWNEALSDTSEMSYRDCFYKYTHLKEIVSDPFSQFLCGDCSADLKNFNLLIEKAVENQGIFEQNLESTFECIGMEIDVCSQESKHEVECVYVMENNDDSDNSKPPIEEEIETRRSGRKKRIFSKTVKTEDFSDDEVSIPARKSVRTVTKSKKGRELNKSRAAAIKLEEEKVKNKKKKIRGKCTYCPKIIRDTNLLKKHERTHKEDRVREKCCHICGLKTFTETILRSHMLIHDENREKKHKCEFCDKAFFHRGACNVHRRIHLGQMVKCPECPKEYCRQVDLDRHMASHTQDPQKHKLKYVVHCKECNKDISSNSYNAHRAAHMNEPLLRCTVCEKDFFSRASCTRHMGRVHKRGKDDYDDIIAYYEKYRPRRSHVLTEQQDEVKAKIV